MAAGTGFRLKLYNSLFDFSNDKVKSEIDGIELLKEKKVLILGEWGTGKTELLRILFGNIVNTTNVFFFDQFEFTDFVNRMKLNANKKENGFVFISNFLRYPKSNPGAELTKLSSLVLDYSNFSFYVATDYNGFKETRESDLLSKMFQVAEIIPVEKVNKQKEESPQPVEEEIIQQKIEPEIQEQKRVPKQKRKAQQFQPTRTRYDEIFREVINSSEFFNLKQAEKFLLEKERSHYMALYAFQKQAEIDNSVKSVAQALYSKLLDSTLTLEEFGRDFVENYVWLTIIPCVHDLVGAHRFSETKRNANELHEKHYPELERKWALELLKTFISENKIVIDPTIVNYSFYFDTPDISPYIFEESIKKQIVEKIFEQEYDTLTFTPLIWGYFGSLGQIGVKDSDNIGLFISSVLLHPKIKAIWDVGTEPGKVPPPPAFNDGREIGKYSPDEASEVDHLDFKHDVHALAALIAYDKTPLPLAIGLFGNWGSGKSSFMKQLENRIGFLSTEQYKNDELANDPDAVMPYCTNITHITFNAWHYSDGNLWASMMVHIFDELLEKIAASKTREELRAQLLKNLSTASEAVVEAEKRVEESTSKLTVAKSTLKTIEGQRGNIDKELDTVKLSLKDVFGTLMKDAQFNASVQRLAKESGYDKVIENKKQLEDWKSEMDSLWERAVRAYKNIYKANKLIAILVVALPVLISLLFYYLYASGILESFNGVIAAAVVSIMPFLGKVMSQVRKITTSLRNLESLQKEKVDRKENELKQREKDISEEIKKHEATVEKQKQEVEAAKKEEADAKAALDAIDINRQLTSFIQQRQGGNSYQQHLGIISLIRKDFIELRKFLKASNKEKKPKERIIERIVLYIDDLDRCKTDRVVAVLEAVHLLLAFDLFVVVVGVDPRWVSKALKEQYKEQLHLDATEDSDTSRLPGQRATPFDYLEKIFQVPFVLRSMDNNGAKKLLDNLFDGQVKSNENTQQAKIVAADKNGTNKLTPEQIAEIEKKQRTELRNTAFLNSEHWETELNKRIQQNIDEAEIKKEFVEQVENLSISAEELEFMKSISPIIGSTPRTVKRYGNLYRLLRVHSDLPNYSPDKLSIYQAVMLLLSISVSNGSIARPFFNALKESKKKGFYDVNIELIDHLKKEAEEKKKEEQDEESKEKLEALKEQLQALHQLEKTLVKMPGEVKDFRVEILKKHSHVVSRFSFRTLNCVDEEEIEKTIR